MAHCDEYLEWISASLDGALSPAESKQLETHLAQCPECRALYEDLLSLHTSLTELPSVEPPQDLTERIMAAVAADKVIPMPVRKPALRHWKGWAATAAAVAVILAGSYGLERQAGSSRPAPAQAVAPQSADLSIPEAAEPESSDEEKSIVSNAVTSGGGDTDQQEKLSAAKIAEPSSTPESGQLSSPEEALDDAPLVLFNNASSPTPTDAPSEDAPEMSVYLARSLPTAETDDSSLEREEPMADGESPSLPASGAESPQQLLSSSPSAPLSEEAAFEDAVSEETTPDEAPSPMPNAVLFSAVPKEEALTPQAALELVAEYCFGNSGYEMTREELEEEVPSAHFTLWDSAQPFTGGTIVYTGEREEFFLFECLWDDDPENPYHYSVHKTERYVAWQGEAPIDGEFRP